MLLTAATNPSFPSERCGKNEKKKKLQIGAFTAVEVMCARGQIALALYREVLLVIEKPKTHVLHFMQLDRRRDLSDAIINSAKLIEP